MRHLKEAAGGLSLSASNLFFVASTLDTESVQKLADLNRSDSISRIVSDVRETVESLKSVRAIGQKAVSEVDELLWPTHCEELKQNLLGRYSDLNEKEYFGLFLNAKQLIKSEMERFRSQSRETTLSKEQLLEQRENLATLVTNSQNCLNFQTAFQLSSLQLDPKVKLSDWVDAVIKFVRQFKGEEFVAEKVDGLSSVFSDMSQIIQHDVSTIIVAHSNARFKDDAASGKWPAF